MKLKRQYLLGAAAVFAIAGGAIMVDDRRRRMLDYYASKSHTIQRQKSHREEPTHSNKKQRVIVIGGGIAGLSVAYYAKKLRSEAHVLVVEADFVAGGSSSHNAGTIGLAQDFNTVKGSREEKRFMPDWQDILAFHSVAAYRELQKDLHLDCEIVECGALLVAETEKEREYVENQYAKYEQKGFDKVELLRSNLQVREKEPMLKSHVLAAVHLPGAIHVDPRKAALSMAEAAERVGVDFIEGDGVVKLAEGKDWSVTLNSGQVLAADIVVLANGMGFKQQQRLLSENLVIPVKGQIVQFTPDNSKGFKLSKMIFSASAHSAFADRIVESIPPQCTMDSSIRHLYGRQKLDGDVLFGGSRIPCAAAAPLSFQANPKITQAIASHAAELINGFTAQDLMDAESWSCYMPFSVDGKPFVGRVESLPRLFLSLGFGPEGMTQAPGAGMLLAMEIWNLKHEHLEQMLKDLNPTRKRRRIKLA